MKHQSVVRFLVSILLLFALVGTAQAYYDGSKLGYLDYVTINGQEFENFDERQIVFYPEDLRDGAVVIRGLLEAEQKNIPVTDLHVEITMNGGKTWKPAKGNGRWEYKFYPDIERSYDFSIRVVENSSREFPISQNVAKVGDELWQIGLFELRTAATVQAEKLSGQGSIALGWLSSYLPERLLDPETKELRVSFENLQTRAQQIISGTVRVATKTRLNFPGVVLDLDSIAFSPAGVVLEGVLSVDFAGTTLTHLPLDGISLTLQGLNGDFSVADPGKPFTLVLFEGEYGATLSLDSLVLNVDMGQKIPVTVKNLSGSLQFGPGYGNLQVPDLSLLADNTIGWGAAAAAEGLNAVTSSLTIPGTNFKLLDIGGAINLSTSSLSLSGKFQFPESLGGGSVSLPAATPLVLSKNGISTSGTLQFDVGTLPALDLSGFPTSLSALSLAIADNIPSGSLAGQVVLTNFASLPLDIAADIDKDGLSGLRIAVPQVSYSYDLADFATLNLSKLELGYSNGDFSVEMDGSITPTCDLVTSISGIGESLAFTGLRIASDAISLADDLKGWHDLTGASVQIEEAALTLNQYGIGVENNKFWVGLKGTGSLAGATVDATARIFHDGTAEITGLQLERLYLAYGDFLLKLDRSAVDANGVVADATQGVIAGLPEIVRTKFPELFNEKNELPVQLNGFNVDLLNNKVTLGSVTITPATPLAFTLGPVSMQLSGMTFSSTGADIDGSLSLAELGLPATDIPFTDLKMGSIGFAGEVDLVGLSGIRNINILDGDYGFGLALSELKVAIDTQLPASQMVKLAGLAGSLQLGSGYGDLSVPNLKLLANNAIAWGQTAVAEGEAVAAEGEAIAGAILTIPGTDFKLADIGGSINLEALSLSLSGKFQFPDSLGGGSVSLPAATPLVLSKNGISTSGTLQFDVGTLPALDLSGFPTSLSALSLAIADNIPSGSLTGQVVLTSFANLPLDIAADIDKDGLSGLRIAATKDTYSYSLADFATLTLTKLALGYDAGAFSVEMDGSILPTNSLVSSLTGIGDSIVFSGLKIAQDAITLADGLGGWHDLSGASANIQGAILTLSEYGIGVENNKFWVGLKGTGSLAGAQVSASARVFHDGTTELSGIDLDKLYLAFGDFSLKVDRSAVDADGLISAAQGTIAGMPEIVISKFPSLFNEANELMVQIAGLSVDLANRQVTLGSVTLTPPNPLEFKLGPVAMKLSSLTFSAAGAEIDGLISLAGIGLPTSEIPFNALQLGRQGFAGEIDLIGSGGVRSVDILEGEFGFGLDLSALRVYIDTQLALADMVQLSAFSGSLRFGSGFGSLSIPDLTMLENGAIHWGKNLAAGVAASASRLTLPGGLFSLGDLGGSINLGDKSLSISGTLILPPELGSATLTIPADAPLTLSVAKGLATSGPVVFNPADLPAIPLQSITSQLTALSIDISHGQIGGSLAGDMIFNQFGGLKVAVAANITSSGLKDFKINAEALNRSFDLLGFATLNIDGVTSGYKNDNFYVQIDGGITPTHTLFSDYQKKVDFQGLRIFKSGIEFVHDMDGWKDLDGGTINLNAAQLTLKQYGLGVENGKLWFGLKGEAAFQDNSINMTAQIFQDGTYKISDLNFEGLTLSLGEFVLRTAAKVSDGKLSGEGFINAGFLMDSIPASMKDPLTGELKVKFENLAVDIAAHKVTSGNISVNFPGGMSVNLLAMQAVLNSVSFGFDGASVDGSLSLNSIAGIAMPSALEGLAVNNISLSPGGFKGSLSWAGESPITLPVLSGEYGLALQLSRVELGIDTSKTSPLEVVKLTDLDGAIKLGSGYNMSQAVTNLRMLAGGAITWGVTDLADAAQEKLEGAVKQVASGMTFTIPGTSFKVQNLAGSLSLATKRVDLWGKINLPADLGGGSISLSQANSLQLTTNGISTRGAVDINPGKLAGFHLAGFSADVSAFSFGVSGNAVSGAISAELKLSKFDNLPIAVSAAFNSSGITEMAIAADRLAKTFNIGDFANINLSEVAGGYEDGAFFVTLDGELTLANSAISNLDRSFYFAGLKVYKDALELDNLSTGMQDIPNATINLNDSMLMSLNQYGLGVTDNRFWIALSGGVTFGGQEVTATAKLYHDGEFELEQLGGNLLIAVGDFTLRTSFDYAGGVIAEATGSLNLGSLMASIPDGLKDPFGELPVTLSNLDIDLSDPSHPKLKSGAIAFNTGFPIITDYFTAQIAGIEVGAVGGVPYGKVLGGTIEFNQMASLPALSGISLTNIGLSGSGFSGTLTWSGSQTVHIFEDPSFGIDAALTSVSIAFDSAKTSLSEMIQLAGVDGSLAFGPGYDTSVTPAIVFDEGVYGFAAGATDAINLPGTSIKLKGFSGSFDFDAASVTVGGRVVVPYESTEIAFDVAGLEFSSSGVSGSVALENPVDIEGLGFPTVLTQASLAFSGFSISSGGLGLDLTLEQFFDLQVSAALTVGTTGITAWSLGGETDASFTADAGFADMTISQLGAGYDSNDGLFFSMNTDITMKGGAVLSGLPDDLTLSGLQVFATSIDVDAAEMSSSFNGATASLGGLDLTLNRLGIGYNEKFYLLAAGKINIANLCEAGAEVKLYSDLTFDLNQIDIEFTNPAVEFSGMLAMYDNDPIYGTGFGAELDVLIAGTLPLTGALQVGSIDNDDSSFSYWRVAMKSGATIPLSPIPMNIYGIGGGIAYHMTVNASMGGATFDPSETTPFALTALVDLGSLDNGYSYFGKFSLTMEPTNFRVVLTGDSWFMEGRGASGTPHLEALIELGASPAMLHVAAQAHLSKELGGMTLLGTDGGVDLLFSESDWHIYFGSAAQKLDVTLLEFLNGSGYIQLDSSGIAMGVRYEFDLEGNAWIFYGRLYGGAEVELAAGIKPFYIDARGKLWIGLEAGVKVDGEKYSIISAYAELEGKFKAPPVYIGLHGKAHYSFLMGLVSGTWEMTFTLPKHPPEGADESNIEDVPLLAYASPENAAVDVSRLTSINVRANMPIMEPFEYDDGNWYILCVKDPTRPDDIVDFNDAQAVAQKALKLRYGTSPKEIVGGRQGQMEMNFTPLMALGAEKTYSYSTTFELRHYNIEEGTIGGVVNSEQVANVFTTTKEDVTFRERVYEVYPTRATTPVYGETPIYVVSKAVFDGAVWTWMLQTEHLRFEVLNAAGDAIPGKVSGKMLLTDDEEGSRRYVLNFIPEQPLEPVRMVENSAGVKRAALIQPDGSYRNPFTTDEDETPAAPLVVALPTVVRGGGAGRIGGSSGSANQLSVADRTVITGTAAVPTTAYGTTPGATPQVSGGAITVAENPLSGAVESHETYTWYWDGEYKIQILDDKNQRQFGAKFNLTLPVDGATAPVYANSQEIVEQNVSDPHFQVNYNVDQEAYQADVSAGRQNIVIAGINALWPEFVNSTHSSAGPSCRYRRPGQVEGLMNLFPYAFSVFITPPWSSLVTTEPLQSQVRRFAMETCAPLATKLDEIDQRFDQYKQNAFSNNPSNDFRSLEFRFRTAAPINWNEVELQVNVSPVFSGEVNAKSCEDVVTSIFPAINFSQPSAAGYRSCQAWLNDILAGASPSMKKNIDRQLHPLKVGPTMKHIFNRNEYIVRSQSGSLDHILELKAPEDAFSGDDLLELIDFNKKTMGTSITLNEFGSVQIYGRVLQEQDSTLVESVDEYSLERGELLYQSGALDDVRPSALVGR